MHIKNIADLKNKKQLIREKIWTKLTESGVARFPGAFGRIPNFVGAEEAARLAATLPEFKNAKSIVANPDSPQFPLRVLALEEGKTIFMAVPKLKGKKPFICLNPKDLRIHPMRVATIKGAFHYGKPVYLEEIPSIDLIITGCVAVTERGHRLGKGGGYSDLEYALLREKNIVSNNTPIITTIHPLQIIPEIPYEEHDLSVHIIVTPKKIIRVKPTPSNPSGIIWKLITEEKISHIPILSQLKSN